MKRKKANIPVYSFVDHQRQPETTPLYSPHVLVFEGILALHDPRIVEMLDVKVSCLHEEVATGQKLSDARSL
jgi:uridine kinase